MHLDGEALCWMTALADDTPLTQLSIPGAHDAASASVTSWTRWTRTQLLDIDGLWNCGVRAFDLRPACHDGQLVIYHGKYSANQRFQDVMQSLLDALGKYPGETAIVLIRHEEEADGNAALWGPVLGAYLQGIREHLVDYRDGITLGEMRGKILLLSRNPYAGGPIGGYINRWNSGSGLADQCGSSVTNAAGHASPLWVQDYYHPDGAEDKWKAVKGLWDAASTAAWPRPLIINHTSGYVGMLPDYRENARNVNARAADYLLQMQGPAGLVMLDFAGVSRIGGVAVSGDRLVQCIIRHN